jgi:hypothetical protein
LNSSHSFLRLLESIRELLENYPINAGMKSIGVVIDGPAHQLIKVQLATGSLGTVATGIAEWKFTLAEGRCTVERSGDGGTVTLRLTGRIDEDGTPVEVSGNAPFDHRRFGADLPPGQITPASFEDIAALALISRSEDAAAPVTL